MIATAVTQYRGKNQRAWLDVSGKELEVLRAADGLYDFRTVYVPAGEAVDELKAFQNFKSMRGEAAGYEGDGRFGSFVQDQWEAWQHRAELGLFTVIDAPRGDPAWPEPPDSGAEKAIDLRIAVTVGSSTTKVKVFNGPDTAFEQELDTPERRASLESQVRVVAAAGGVAVLFCLIFVVLHIFAPHKARSAEPPVRYSTQLDDTPLAPAPPALQGDTP